MEEVWGGNIKLKEIIDRQIDTIIGSVYGTFFSASTPEDVSFHDILNRIMLLLQAPIIFVLCKEDKENNTKKSIYRFNSHPLHQVSITKALNKAILANQLFPLFETKTSLIDNSSEHYYLLVLLVENHDKAPFGLANFIPLSPDNKKPEHTILVYKLSQVLDGNLYQERFNGYFLDKLQSVLNRYEYLKDLEEGEAINKTPISTEDEEEYGNLYGYFEYSLKNDSNEYNLLHYGVIDKIYKKAHDSLLLYASKKDGSRKFLSNFILFMRDFDGTKRCENEAQMGYDYNLRIMISSKQEQDIIDYFEWLKKNKDEYENWYITKNFPNVTDKENDYYSLAVQVNDFFWKKLEDNDIGYIITAIGNPFGKKAYSMADPVFKDGIINFRNPSVNAGLHRAYNFKKDELKTINYESIEECNELKNDLLRIVALHYLMLGMAIDPDNFRVMLCPIEVGGRILAVMGYVTTHTNSLTSPDSFHDELLIEFSANWRKCYHTYNDLYARLKRYMRSYFWQLYIKIISKICANSIPELSNSRNEITVHNYEKSLNKRLMFLTKFFSFSGISFSVFKDSNIRNEKIVELSNKYILYLNDENASYPSACGRIIEIGKFIDYYEIVSRINTELYYEKYNEKNN